MRAPRAAGRLLVSAAALAAAIYAMRASHDFKAYWYNVPNLFGGPYPIYGPNSGWGWPLTYRSGPLFLFLFAPLTLLELRVAAGLWAAGKIATLAWLAPRLHGFALQGRPRRGSWWSYAWLPALASYAYVVREIESGNVQFYVFALAAMGFIWMRTRPDFAALSLAGAIAIKLFPLFFMPYLWLRGERALVRRTAVFLAILLLLPAAYFGPLGNVKVLRDWFVEGIGEPSQPAWEITPDHSLLGVASRYLARADYSRLPDPNYAEINMADLPRGMIAYGWMAAAVLGYAGLLGLAVKARRAEARGAATLALEAALLFTALLLLEPVTQRIYLVALLLPVMALSAELRHGALGSGARLLGALSLGCFALPPLLQLPGVARWLTVYSPDFWGMALLAAALALALRDRLREFVPSAGGAGMAAGRP